MFRKTRLRDTCSLKLRFVYIFLKKQKNCRYFCRNIVQRSKYTDNNSSYQNEVYPSTAHNINNNKGQSSTNDNPTSVARNNKYPIGDLLGHNYPTFGYNDGGGNDDDDTV